MRFSEFKKLKYGDVVSFTEYNDRLSFSSDDKKIFAWVLAGPENIFHDEYLIAVVSIKHVGAFVLPSNPREREALRIKFDNELRELGFTVKSTFHVFIMGNPDMIHEIHGSLF